MRSLRQMSAAVSALAVAFVLAACGTTADAESTSDATTAEADGAEETSEDAAEAAAGPITLTDSDGNEVVLENGPATKIVALEWAQAETLSSLGVELVGLSDVAGYTSWVGTAVPLIGEPTDVGTRTEPSVETIAALEPDLIVAVARSIPDEVRSQMEQIAPILVLNYADAADPLGQIATSVDTLAQAVGMEEEGAALNDELTATLEENAAALEAAGLTGTPVVFTSPYADGNTVQIRMHGPGSAVGTVMTEMGLVAAWTDAGDEAYGLSYTDVEGLTALAAESWFFWWANADEEDPVTTYLEPNAVWASLAFVQEGRVAGIADGIWAYGGPESLAAFSDDVVRALGAE